MTARRTSLTQSEKYASPGQSARQSSGSHPPSRQSARQVPHGHYLPSRQSARQVPQGLPSSGQNSRRTDYRIYIPSPARQAGLIFLYAALSMAIGWLFFGRAWTFLFFLPGIPWYLRLLNKKAADRQRMLLTSDFRSALDLLSIALKAGNSVDRAFPAAAKELQNMKGKDAAITKEFLWISSQMELKIPPEELLSDLAMRSGCEDIRSFAAVFATAKRMGGNMPQIIRSAADTIGAKMDVNREIETSLASKKSEHLVMSVMPCGILLYMRLSSPGFLDIMYSTAIGLVIMAAALAVYAAAVLWGRKIVNIKI